MKGYRILFLLLTVNCLLLTFSISAAKEYDREIQEYRNLLEKNPDDLDAAYRMGTLYAWRGDYDEAIRVYEGVLQKEPRYVEAELGAARAYAWKGDNLLAKARFEEIVRKYPRNHEAYQGLASLCLWNNDFEGAIDYYSRALAIKPTDGTTLKGLGRAYLGRGDRRRAEDYFTKAQIEELKKTPLGPIAGWLGVIVFVVGTIVFAVRYFIGKFKKQILWRELQLLRYAVALYHRESGKFPVLLERLENEQLRLMGLKGEKKYLENFRKGDRGFFVDPFGNRYLYNPDTGGVFSITKGAEEW